MPVPKTDALPLGYTPYGRSLGRGGKGEAGLEERAVQGRGDIASKQQGSPFRTDYNKLATLIERNGKLSALFACNAMPIKARVACFSSPRLPAHVIREEKAASGSSLSRATGRRTTTASCSRPAASFDLIIQKNPRLKKKLLNQRRAKSAAGLEHRRLLSQGSAGEERSSGSTLEEAKVPPKRRERVG
ncbi:hypothetical protein NE237_007398 [Protea cynaroides]|uniref:Uncharacterized protein n=1 Tax=Protea cynaroides TaxID=273540 RepID=A0A9Q0KPF3_9MAGN|nr:hypothetical protein NE237_007398 [Protea cynaroides]